jgi:hypothetical protein
LTQIADAEGLCSQCFRANESRPESNRLTAVNNTIVLLTTLLILPIKPLQAVDKTDLDQFVPETRSASLQLSQRA